MTSKIPVRTVKSDACVIHIGRIIKDGDVEDEGKAYQVHKGESIKVLPIMSVRQYIAWNKMMGSLTDPAKLEEALDSICLELSNKVVDWDWTDLNGEPLPKPYHNPDVFKQLAEEEIVWLSSALVETPEQRKNA